VKFQHPFSACLLTRQILLRMARRVISRGESSPFVAPGDAEFAQSERLAFVRFGLLALPLATKDSSLGGPENS
jgi:hypothetical protein